jgi:hypothetical protein
VDKVDKAFYAPLRYLVDIPIIITCRNRTGLEPTVPSKTEIPA